MRFFTIWLLVLASQATRILPSLKCLPMAIPMSRRNCGVSSWLITPRIPLVPKSRLDMCGTNSGRRWEGLGQTPWLFISASEGIILHEAAALQETAPRREEIHWFEWHPESFQLAKILDRPILLDLTAVWCYWCREMEENSYADSQVVRLANELFVPIRVNVDRRPDISERYNFGGLPTTAILTPDGDTISAGTYIPAEELKTWLLSQSEYFRAQKVEIKRRLASFAAETSPVPAEGELSEAIIRDLRQCLLENFDRVYGGFGTQPKFPLPDAVELALNAAHTTGEEVFRRILTKTLNEMAIGGLFDRIEGGFHRYSTTRDWSSPHFEKILEGNSELLRNYVRAYKLTGDEEYRKIGERTVEYMLKTLWDPEKAAFYGSQAADEEYYNLPRDERLGRKQPSVDKTFYTSWNACAIISLIEAASISPLESNLLSQCENVANFLFKVGFDESKGMHHYFDPAPTLTGLLTDNLEMASALLNLHMATGNQTYLRRANELAQVMQTEFWDKENGGFCDRVKSLTAEGHLRHSEKNLQENSTIAEFLLKLGALTGNAENTVVAGKTLELFADSYSELGLQASGYAQTVNLALHGTIRIQIVGSRIDSVFQEFLKAASSLLEPRCVVLPLDIEESRERIRQLHTTCSTDTYARVCTDTMRSEPLSDPSELAVKVSAVAKATSSN